MTDQIRSFIFDSLGECFDYMKGPLGEYQQFAKKLASRIQVKQGDNEQFNFDVELDKIMQRKLIEHEMTGHIFSEESNFFALAGEHSYRIVYDPFCNSSLASRTFREGALGISIFNNDYSFITAAILDYQTGILALVEDGQTQFYQLPDRGSLKLVPSKTTALADAWVVLTLENAKERLHISDVEVVLSQAKRIIVSSGHLYWLKLAAGFIDAYLDPIGGEPLYEMFACTIAQKAGCVVTDTQGRPFDAGHYLKIFEQDQDHRFYPVAAATSQLHKELLESLHEH